MSQQIVIAEQLRIAAVLSDERVDELIVAQGRYQIGDVYLGTVENVLPGIDAAFVNIGESEKNGFIQNGIKIKEQSTFSNIVKKTYENKKYVDEHELIARIYEEIPVRLAPSISEVKEKIKQYSKKSDSSLEKFF